MKKVISVAGVLIFAATLYFGIHFQITRDARAALAADCPELIWLKREFQLSGQQYQRIESLHQKHDSHCKDLCKDLADSQKKLLSAMTTSSKYSNSFQSALADWRKEQLRSQDSIIKHMFEVSAEMDEAQGVRYRELVYKSLIIPGRTPHIDTTGNYNSEFIQHLKK